MTYETLFPISSVKEPLERLAAQHFVAFAQLAHSFGFDWWHADHTACWGRKRKGEAAAKIRLGRLLTVGTDHYVTVSVSANAKEAIERLHGPYLKSIGELQRKDDSDSRYLVPLQRATSVFNDMELVQTMLDLATTPETVGYWEADYASEADSMLVEPVRPWQHYDVRRPSVTGCPPGSSEQRMAFIRRGHDAFRRRVVDHWGGQCAVRGPVDSRLLIASHIVPWAEATDVERTDFNNGLLLSSPLDALFDIGLISFDDQGQMLTKELDLVTAQAFGLSGAGACLRDPMSKLTDAMKGYLQRHRARYGF